MSVNPALLPYVDEHATVVAAAPAQVWPALLRAAEGTTAADSAARFAGLLGCADTVAAGPRPLATGSAFPGFHVATATEPAELAIGTRMHVLVTNRIVATVKSRAER